MPAIPALDIAAFVSFLVVWIGYDLVGGLPAIRSRSIVGAMQEQRLAWLRIMARRDSRIVDAQLLGALSQGNAFFASTSAIAIGGLTAVIGSGDKAMAFLDKIPYAAPGSALMWELKIVLMIAIFMFAFFKFAWAFRLSHYTAIMIGATPLPDEAPADVREAHGARTAALIGIAAEHANSGLRSFYHAMAAMAWFFHPALFLLATVWVLLILIRRDFFSRARRAVVGAEAGPAEAG